MISREIFSQIGFASVIMAVGIAAQALSDIFIARHLDPEEYGSFTLIFRDAVTILSSILLLGIDSSLVRLFGREEIAQYRWKTFLTSAGRIIFALSFLFGTLLTLLYALQLWNIIAIGIVVTLLSTLTLFATVLRVRNLIPQAQTGLHAWRVGFALLILPLYFTGFFSVATLVGLLGLSLILSLLILIKSASKIPQGDRTVLARPLLQDGILFFGLSTSSLLMLRIERFFLGGLENLSEVAGYYAVSVPVLTLYWILASSGAYVLLPQFSRGVGLKAGRSFAFLIALGLLLGIPFFLYGNELIAFLFGGRYDRYSFLIPFFVAIGTLQLVYVVPSSFIGGRATTRQLRIFLFFGLSALAGNIVLCLVLIPSFGVMGAVMANLTAWLGRLGAATWFTGRILRTLARPDPS